MLRTSSQIYLCLLTASLDRCVCGFEAGVNMAIVISKLPHVRHFRVVKEKLITSVGPVLYQEFN